MIQPHLTDAAEFLVALEQIAIVVIIIIIIIIIITGPVHHVVIEADEAVFASGQEKKAPAVEAAVGVTGGEVRKSVLRQQWLRLRDHRALSAVHAKAGKRVERTRTVARDGALKPRNSGCMRTS